MNPLIIGLVSGLLTATAAQSAPQPTIRAVHLALSDGLKATPRLDTLYMRTGGSLHGWLVVEARYKGKTVFYSQAPKVRKGRRIIRTTKWPTKTFGAVTLRIAKLEPVVPHQGIYDNTGKMEPYWHPEERKDHPQKWHWCPIEYTESFISKVQKQWIQPLDTTPASSPLTKTVGVTCTLRVR